MNTHCLPQPRNRVKPATTGDCVPLTFSSSLLVRDLLVPGAHVGMGWGPQPPKMVRTGFPLPVSQIQWAMEGWAVTFPLAPEAPHSAPWASSPEPPKGSETLKLELKASWLSTSRRMPHLLLLLVSCALPWFPCPKGKIFTQSRRQIG